MAEKGSRRGDRIAGSGIKMSGSNSGAGLRTTLVSRCWRRTVWTRAAVPPKSRGEGRRISNINASRHFCRFLTTVKSRGEIILTKDARINLRV